MRDQETLNETEAVKIKGLATLKPNQDSILTVVVLTAKDPPSCTAG